MVQRNNARASIELLCFIAVLTMLVVISIILPDYLRNNLTPGKTNACNSVLGIAIGAVGILGYDRYMHHRGK